MQQGKEQVAEQPIEHTGEQPAEQTTELPAAPAAPSTAPATRQAEPAPTPAQANKPTTPVKGENVAAIEAKVKAGETISLTALSDAIKNDKAATGTPAQGDPGAKRPSPGKTVKDKTTGTKAKARQPSIKEQLEAGKKRLNEQKPSAPQKTATKTKTTGLGD